MEYRIRREIIDSMIGSYLLKLKLDYDFDELLCNLDRIELDKWKRGVVFGRPIARSQMWFNLDKKSIMEYSLWNYKVGSKIDESYNRWISHDYLDYKWLLDFQLRLEQDIDELFVREGIYDEYDIKKIKFNSVLLNKYTGGSDYIKYHRDCEYIFGDNPNIVSVSIGHSRIFSVRRIQLNLENKSSIIYDESTDKKHNLDLLLNSGDIIIMAGTFQKYFAHGIPIDDSDVDKVRYNLTFRFACGNH